jgi:general secretion pathway protein H
MPMWVTGKHNNGSNSQKTQGQNWYDAGFTLIELLVVIVIIGLMASVVALNLPPNSKSLSDETDIIAARFQLAAQEAILTGSVIGLSFDQDGYTFIRRINRQWAPYAPAGLSGKLQWPDSSKLNFKYEGEKIALPRRNVTSEGQIIPSVFFLPSGEAQNFNLTFSSPRSEQTILVQVNGHISRASGARF